MSDAPAPRVVMVALDAMEVTVLEHLVQAGTLPNIAKFIAAGARGEVRSDGETLHGSLWPTFASGTGPATHGLYFWTQWLQEEMGYGRNSHPLLAFEPFWARIADAGLPVTVIDTPYVPLVRHPEVVQVSGWGTHDEVESVAWPQGYGQTFRKRFGKHPLEFDTVEPQSAREKLALVRTLMKGTALRAAAFDQVLRDRPGPGFHSVLFGETHKAGHYLAAPQQLGDGLDNVTAFGRMLKPLDDAWPRLLDAAGPEAHVFLFALHGVVEQVDYSATLGMQLLALALGKQPEAGVPPADLLRRARNLLPASVHRAIWRRLPPRMRASRQGTLSSAGLDFERDPVFRVAHDGHLALRKNLRGRERDGRFAEEETEAAIEAVAELARQFRTVEGVPAFERMWRAGEAAGDGSRRERLPDALLLANPRVTSAARLIGPGGTELTTAEPEARNGIHNGRGFVFVRMPAGSTAKLRRTEIDNRDFAPSILDLFGIPAPVTSEGVTFFR